MDIDYQVTQIPVSQTDQSPTVLVNPLHPPNRITLQGNPLGVEMYEIVRVTFDALGLPEGVDSYTPPTVAPDSPPEPIPLGVVLPDVPPPDAPDVLPLDVPLPDAPPPDAPDDSPAELTWLKPDEPSAPSTEPVEATEPTPPLSAPSSSVAEPQNEPEAPLVQSPPSVADDAPSVITPPDPK